MPLPDPPLYFRLRDNGATVFRIDASNRQRRLELEPIAQVSLRNGQIRPQGGREITPAERAAIAAFIEARRAELERRAQEEARRTIEAMNQLAHWLQSRAEPAEVEAIADDLLLAMHDLRQVLLRRRAEALSRGEGGSGGAEVTPLRPARDPVSD